MIGDFNSHAHVERDIFNFECAFVIFHFNSHAHVERDPTNVSISQYLYISTHTLTWSVTIGLLEPTEIIKISTHTLTWSVT